MRRAQRSDIQDSTSSPLRNRRYFNPVRGGPQTPSNLGSATSQQYSTDPAEPNDEPVRVIWGTNVSIQECSNIFREFLLSFKYKYRRDMEGELVEPEDHELYYVNQLNTIMELGLTNLNLDAKNLLSYPSTRKLYYQLINYPQEIIPIMDHTIKDCLIQIINDSGTTSPAESKLDEIETNVYTIRPYNVNMVEKGIRELNPNDIDKLVSVKGLTLRSTSIIPDMKVAFSDVMHVVTLLVLKLIEGLFQNQLNVLEVCGQRNSMVLIHNRSSFSDKQVIKLQETPDLVPDGQTPHSINLCVYDELVDSCRAGDRVEVCGIFRSTPVRANPRQER